MKNYKKLFCSFLVLLLVLLPITVYAQGNNKEASISTQSKQVSAKLSSLISPKKSKISSQAVTNPADYPLIKDGQYVDTLYDSYYSTHKITFTNVTSYSSSQMKLNLQVQQDYNYIKDGLLYVEFYKASGSTLNYLGAIEFNTYGGLNWNLGSIIDKSYYNDQPYIYIRIGVCEYETDTYYSDTTYFKVANPFYTGTQPPPTTGGQGNYVVINNESTSGTATEYSGSFSINNQKYTFDKNLKLDSYLVDVNKPFDAAKNKDKLISKYYPFKSFSYAVGDSKSFWVTNFSTNSDYQITAKLLYSGTSSNVWVWNNQITSQDATKLGTEFDTKIHPLITNNFGSESDVDANGKVNILVYDIQDGFSGSGAYVGGYFYAGDLYNITHSNQSEIFYMDTYPSLGIGTTKDVTGVYNILAHEFQHMVNFNRNVLIEGSTQPMESWLNEGLSMAAEQIYTGKVITSRIDYYNTSSSITNGHSLLYWDNNNDVLSNYSLSYLFGQYVKIQAKQGDKIFKEILNDSNNNYKAVEDVVKKYINSSMSFGQFTTKFRGALVLKEPSGLYGFGGISDFSSIKAKLYGGSGIYLRGGGALVKQLDPATTFTPPTNKGSDITYTILSDSGDTVPPVISSVNKVTDKDTVVTGVTEAKAKVSVYKGSSLLGSSTADSTGKFSVTIAKQPGDTVLSVYAQDAAGNKSSPKTITVVDTTPPAAPIVNSVADNQTAVTGKAEAGAKVIVMTGTTTLGTGTTTSTGTFSVPINKQVAGTKLLVYAQDKTGNKSVSVTVTVVDKTAPAKPVLNTSIGDNQTIINGKTEAGATVVIKAGTTVLGQGTASSTGSFTIKISAFQKVGASLSIYASDKAGNTSYITVNIVDKTPPAAPVVNKITYTTTAVTGKAEVKSTIYIYYGSTLIGKGVTDTYGNFKITISRQKQGITLEVYAMDPAENQSNATLAKVY